MKNFLFLFVFSVYAGLAGLGQTIEYTHQTVVPTALNTLKLVADVAGFHHLLCFSANARPQIYIFDSRLQLTSTRQIEITVRGRPDIKVIQFAAYYYLYMHSAGSLRHELFKIDGAGNIVGLTKKLEGLIQTELEKSTATLQLINQEEQLYIISHIFYVANDQIKSSVVKLDKDLNSMQARKVFNEFHKNDYLEQVQLAGNNLLVLNTGKINQKSNVLLIHKIDLNTGQSVLNSFNSGGHLYINPRFTYNPKDSGILISSLISEPPNSSKEVSTVFISRLDHLLQERVPVALLKKQFRKNALTNYLFIQGQYPSWLSMNINPDRSRTAKLSSVTFPTSGYRNANSSIDIISNRTATIGGYNFYDPLGSMDTRNSELFRYKDPPSGNLSDASRNAYRTHYYLTPDDMQADGLRFSVLNEKLKIINDSMVSNNKRVARLQSRPYGQFNMHNKAYLILIQNITDKGKGLVMISTDDNGQLESSEIRVHLRYEYLVSQLQAVGNEYFILPFINKKEIGLVKVNMNN